LETRWRKGWRGREPQIIAGNAEGYREEGGGVEGLDSFSSSDR